MTLRTPARRRGACWAASLAFLLVVQAAMPLLAWGAAAWQGVPLADVCAVYGVRTVALGGPAAAAHHGDASSAASPPAVAALHGPAPAASPGRHAAPAAHAVAPRQGHGHGHAHAGGHDAHGMRPAPADGTMPTHSPAHHAAESADAAPDHVAARAFAPAAADADRAPIAPLAADATGGEHDDDSAAAHRADHCALMGLAALAARGGDAHAWLAPTGPATDARAAATRVPHVDAVARWLAARVHAPPARG